MKNLLTLFATRLLLVLGVLGATAWLSPGPIAAQGLAGAGLPAFWTWQNPQPVGVSFNDVAAPNDSVAYVGGNQGVLLKTTNRGRNWQVLNVGTTLDVRRVSFGNAQAGWALTALNFGQLPAGTRGAQVRRTTDGGLTWTLQTVGTINANVQMLDMVARSPLDALVLVGAFGSFLLYRTTDGGLTWTYLANNLPNSPVAGRMQFTSLTVGYITVTTSGFNSATKLLKTTDGGANWVDVSPTPDLIVAADFTSGQAGWATNDTNSGPAPAVNLYTTTNGGTTWQPRNIGRNSGLGQTPSPLLHVAFADARRGIAVGSFEVFNTADGGLTWSRNSFFPEGRSLRANRLLLSPSGSGWLVGDGGRLAYTADFGLTWASRSQSLNDFRNYGQLSQLQTFEPGHAWALIPGSVSYGAALLKTTRRGEPWSNQPTGLVATNNMQVSYRALHFADRDTGIVQASTHNNPTNTTTDLVLHTTDAGQTWTSTPLALLPQTDAAVLSFRDARRGLLFTDRRQALLTTDGGRTWQPRATGAAHSIFAATWASPQTVYALGDSATAIKSFDGGLSWQPMPTLSALLNNNTRLNRGYCGLGFATPQTGIVVTGFDGYQRTTDGGATWTTFRLPDIDNQTVTPINVSFTSATEGWLLAGGTSGSFILTTRNAGLTWTVTAKVSNGNNGDYPAFVGAFVDRYNGYTGGADATILRYSEKFITATPLAQTTHCAGAALSLAFTTTGTFPAAERRFTAQLSNARGRFRPGQIRVVGQGTASPLAVALPFDLPAGSAYRLRVVQADSLVLGADTGQDLTINAAPTAAIAPAGPQTLCAGSTLTLTAPAGLVQYLWSTGATTRTLAVGAAGSYTVRGAGANGCLGPLSAAVAVTVALLPPAPVLAHAPGGPVTVLAPLAGATYQWTRNGTALPGTSGPQYPAAGAGAAPAGTYAAVATSAAGCASPASAPLAVVLAVRGALPAGWALYPNPADERLTVELAPGGGPVQLTLFDALGRVVRTLATSAARTALDVRGLPEGTYWLRAVQADGQAGGQAVQVRR